MTQAMRPLEDTGKKREGKHSGGIRQKYVLTDQGRKLLLATYDGKSATIDDLARRLVVPRWTVKHWAGQLGLARQKEPRWTQEELDYLERTITRKSVKEIARHLGRTQVAVKLKAKRMDFRKTHEGYTMCGLCLGLGCDHHKVEFWLQKGWLRGSRRHTERKEQQRGDIWFFSDTSIRKLIKEHPNEIDPRRADWLWLVDVLVGLGDLSAERGEHDE